MIFGVSKELRVGHCKIKQERIMILYLKYSGTNRILETGNNNRDVDKFNTSKDTIIKHFFLKFMIV